MASQSVDDFLSGGGASAGPALSSQSVDDFLGAPAQAVQAQAAGAGPTPESSWSRYPRMALQDVSQGVIDLANIPSALQSAYNGLLGTSSGPLTIPRISLPHDPSLDPQSTGERLASGALRGTGAALGGLGLGAGLGVLGQVAGEAAPVLPAASDLAPLAKKATETLTTQGAIPGAVGAEAGELTQNADPRVQAAASAISGAVSAVGLHHVLQTDAIGNVAKALGDSTSLQQAGSAAQDAVRDWRANTLPQTLSALKAPVLAKLPPDAEVDNSELIKTLHDITTKAGANQQLADTITSGLPQRLQDAMKSQAQTGKAVYTTPPGGTPVLTGLSVPVGDAMQFRSYLGDLMANPKLIKDSDQATIANLYRAASTDLASTMATHGASGEWDAFNKGSTDLYSAGRVMSKISNDVNPAKDTIRPEDAATSVLNAGKKGNSDLAVLRQHVPDAVNELGAGMLSEKPEMWNKLPDASKESLIPSPYGRGLVESAQPGPRESATSHGIQSLVGGGLGELIPHVAASALGPEALGGILDPHLSGLIGLVAPAVLRGAMGIARRPGQLVVPGRGAVAGLAGQEPGPGNPLGGFTP